MACTITSYPAAMGVGPLSPDRGDVGIDEPRIDRPQRRVVDLEGGCRFRAAIDDHHVDGRHEAVDDRLAFNGLEIDGDVALVAVEGEESAAVGRRLDHMTPRLTRRWLDLDDVCTHVTEQHPGQRAGNGLGELEDPHAFQRPYRHPVPSLVVACGDTGRITRHYA